MTLLDYSSGVIAGAAIRAAGHAGAIRYVESPTHPLLTKHVTPQEYADLIGAGLEVLLVFEVDTTDALGGFVNGVDYAIRAQAGAQWIGYPPDRPIFFAADTHLTPAQIPTAMAYLDGAASVLGVPRVGAYGFGEFVDAARAGNHAAVFWLCGSQPSSASPAHLWQNNTTSTTVAGVACDINEILRPLPAAPITSQEDPMMHIPIDVKSDGAFRATACAESGGPSQVVAQAWIDLGSTWGGTGFRVTALAPNGAVLAVWPAGTPAGQLGHVANNATVPGIVLPAGTTLVTIEGKVDDPTAGTVPAASVASLPR